MTYFGSGVDFQSKLTEDQNSLASRVFAISIANPDTGKCILFHAKYSIFH